MSETVKTTPKKLAIIDGKSVFYRGYYAMPNLATADGTPTGGVFGFATMALEVLKRLKPDYVCVAWDKPKTNIRSRLKLYSEYKAGRKPAPPDFYAQIPVLHELLEAFGWPLYELDDYEADDIMGTLAVQATKKGIKTLLITSDLDVLQLVDLDVSVFALKKGLSNIELFAPKSFTAKYGLNADQFLDLKALKGDSSDNIPGVPGIGEKTAIELLKQYKTLDSVYDNLALIKEAWRKKLEAGKDLAYLSKKLGAIWTDAPIKLDLKAVDGSRCNPAEVARVLQKLEFRSLVRQLPEAMQLPPEAAESSVTGRQSPVFSGGKNVIIDSEDKLKRLDFKKSKELVVYSRSGGKHGKNPQLLILSPDPKTVYTLDLTKLSQPTLVSTIQDLKSIIGYDVKSTLKVLLELGINLSEVKHDVLIGAFLLNSLRREQTLTELAQADLGYEGSSFENLTPDELAARATEIVAVIRALYAQQSKVLASSSKLQALASTVEWPVIPVLAGMEYMGIQLDTKYLEKFSEQINDSIIELEQQIYGHADYEFNIASPAQLADVLFGKLQLPTDNIKKGKTGYSTGASELEKLRLVHPIIDLITQYREVVKLKNTYVDTLPQLVDEHSRLHTTFNLTVAQTGRLSSADPNLQNIPVRTELGKHIRTAFVAGPGNLLISADYSQFELRLAAVLAKDKELVKLFNEGADIHTATAAQVYEINPKEVTKNQRRHAKVINFGILYGMSPHGLSVATGMSFEIAREFIKKYFELRRPLLDYMNHLKDKARKDGYVETLFGRRRPMPDIHSSNFVVRQAAERAAINMPIQGTEADLMKMAMVSVQQKLDEFPVASHQSLIKRQETGDRRQETNIQSEKPRILLQIHDSLIVEAPKSIAQEVAQTVKQTMQNIYKLPVKLDVDTAIGKNWGEL